MKERYHLSARALDDLDGIWDHIGDDDPIAADGFILKLLETCAAIADMPMMGRARNEFEKGLRSFPVGSYFIFYRITKHDVEIARFLHGGQDLHAIFAQTNI